MDFTIQLTQFLSLVHKHIYTHARQIIPLEKSLSCLTDESLRTSCEQLYGFTMAMLSDMYDHPDAYFLPVSALETFMGNKKLNALKRDYPSKTKNLISQTRNVVERYMHTLGRMIFLGTVSQDKLTVPEDAFPEIRKNVSTSVSPILLEQRLAALSRVGFIQTQDGFISRDYPKMFPAAKALIQKAGGKYSGFDFYHFTKLEFRNISQNYIPTHEDYYTPLPDNLRNSAFLLHDIALECGCKESVSTFMKVEYKYRGVQVMMIDSDENRIDVRVTEVYGWDDHSLFTDRLELESDELKLEAKKHLWRCSGCSTSHVGQMIEFLGMRNRVCGGGQIGFVWWNPEADTIDKIRYFIRTRCEIIDQMKKKKK